MGHFEFGHNDKNTREYFPNHAGIDWHQAYLSRHESEPNSVWGETFDELGEFCEQLHQENTCFYINETDPTFDVIVVIDHRDDGGDWWLTREQIGSEEFDELLDGIGEEVMVVHTKYPLKMVAEFVTQSLFSDLDKFDGN